jgi:hypothetical protein
MLVCPDCGSIRSPVALDAENPDWYDNLLSISDRIPARERAEAWIDSRRINEQDAEDTVNGMKASLYFKPDADGIEMWWRRPPGKTKPQGYVDIWSVFQTWSKRNGVNSNGYATKTKPARGSYY